MTYNYKGRLIEKGEYKFGIKEGHWVSNNEYGNFSEEGEYKLGIKEGKWMRYSQYTRSRRIEENYKNGIRINGY